MLGALRHSNNRLAALATTRIATVIGLGKMKIGIFLVEQGLVTAEQLVEALSRQMADRVSVGQLAMEAGILTKIHVLHILSIQSKTQQRFGQVAVDLGYLDKAQLADLLLEQDERLRPLSDILVAMGTMERDRMEVELKTYRQQMADSMDSSGVLRTVV